MTPLGFPSPPMGVSAPGPAHSQLRAGLGEERMSNLLRSGEVNASSMEMNRTASRSSTFFWKKKRHADTALLYSRRCWTWWGEPGWSGRSSGRRCGARVCRTWDGARRLRGLAGRASRSRSVCEEARFSRSVSFSSLSRPRGTGPKFFSLSLEVLELNVMSCHFFFPSHYHQL